MNIGPDEKQKANMHLNEYINSRANMQLLYTLRCPPLLWILTSDDDPLFNLFYQSHTFVAEGSTMTYFMCYYEVAPFWELSYNLQRKLKTCSTCMASVYMT